MTKIKELLNNHNFWKVITVIIGIIGIIGVTVWQINEFNHGTCKRCGGHYELIDVERGQTTDFYYYQCDNCKDLIRTNFMA